jgi:hypothetical protein
MVREEDGDNATNIERAKHIAQKAWAEEGGE